MVHLGAKLLRLAIDATKALNLDVAEVGKFFQGGLKRRVIAGRVKLK
jgi:hypothetical protein